MSDSQYLDFILLWKQIMYASGAVAVFVSVLLRVVHSARVAGIKEYKAKYDYLSKQELKIYWYSALSFSIGIFLVLNTLEEETVLVSGWWFIIRIFIAACIGTLIAYVSYLVLKFYFPGRLQRKLDKWRYIPRTSSTGNKMNLLSEEEEDVYLDEGMQAEENIFSVDYDVWVDPESDEIKIEKYPGYMEVLQCQSCTFQTLKLDNEEIIRTATETQEGELLKNYVCSYCKSTRTTKHKIGKLIKSDKDFKLPIDYKVKKKRQVQSIMVEILSNTGERAEFFFQNQGEASRFLEEFNFDKVPESEIVE